MFSVQSWLSRLRKPKDARREEVLSIPEQPLSRFGAMAKLVDEQEFIELAGQGGLNAQLLRRLRAQRRRAFRLYLSELEQEFLQIQRQALDRAANDPGVDPRFAEEVLNLKARFTISVWLLRLSLWFPAIAMAQTHQRTLDLVGSLKPLFSKPSS